MAPLEPNTDPMLVKEDAVLPTRSGTIPVTPIVTLTSLAAEGKFVSASLEMPHDWLSADWQFSRDGILWEAGILLEVYAPGDDTGWAVVYVPDEGGGHTGETELLRGNWTIKCVGHNISRRSKASCG